MWTLFYWFFSQKVLLGALFFLFFMPKAVRSGLVVRPTSLPKDAGYGWAARYFQFYFFTPLDFFFMFSYLIFFLYGKEKIN